MFQALLGMPQMEATHSFESLNEEEAVAIEGSSREKKPFSYGEGSVLASPSPMKSLPSAAGQSPETSSFFDDMALNDVSLIIHHTNIYSPRLLPDRSQLTLLTNRYNLI